MYIYQKANSIGALEVTMELIEQLNLQETEYWEDEDIKALAKLLDNQMIGSYVKNLLWNDEKEIPEIAELINWINHKRAYCFLDSDGEAKIVAIPSNRIIGETLNDYSKRLMTIAMEHYYYRLKDNHDDKEFHLDNFNRQCYYLKLELSSRVFSKNFKEKFSVMFNGFTGVALTGNCGYNEIEIPTDFAIKYEINVGDDVIVFRDPVQHLYITCKVSNILSEQIRINGETIQLLCGDFDGDKLGVVPVNGLLKHLSSLGVHVSNINKIREELSLLKPTLLSARFSSHNENYILSNLMGSDL